MAQCVNLDCGKSVWGTKLRCSKCRHGKIYTCCSCGDEVINNVNRSCNKCQIFRTQLLRERYSNMIRSCMGCGKELRKEVSGEKKWCRLCADTIVVMLRKRKTLNCKVCGKGLSGTAKHSYCSDECYKVNRKIYLTDRHRINYKKRE